MDEARYGRLMTSFKRWDPEYIIETDGSLSQVGIILYKNGQSGETCIGGAAVSILDFGFGDQSRNQNASEYIGRVLVVLALVKMGVRNVDVTIREDSTSALMWMETGRIRSKTAMNAAVVLTAICVKFGIRTRYSAFLSGIASVKADRLSRIGEKGLTIKEAMIMNSHEHCPIIDLRDNPASDMLVRMCNPNIAIENEEEFTLLWANIREALEPVV